MLQLVESETDWTGRQGPHSAKTCNEFSQISPRDKKFLTLWIVSVTATAQQRPVWASMLWMMGRVHPLSLKCNVDWTVEHCSLHFLQT